MAAAASSCSCWASSRRRRMDAAWIATLADKDYIFPHDMVSAGTWLINLSIPSSSDARTPRADARGLSTLPPKRASSPAVWRWSRRLRGEPAVHRGAACAAFVQLQFSRVFWMADPLAMLYVAWWLCEAWSAAHGGRVPRRAIATTVGPADRVARVLAVVAAARGWYVLLVEHPGRPFVAGRRCRPTTGTTSVDLAASGRTPDGAHVLADPGHAWKYGTSLRVSAGAGRACSRTSRTARSPCTIVPWRCGWPNGGPRIGDFATLTASADAPGARGAV